MKQSPPREWGSESPAALPNEVPGAAVEADALSRPGCKPMDFTGRPMKGFVFVHPEGYETEAQLRHWLELALDFNPRAQASKKKAKRAR
jgi:hypothetical protein